MRFGIRARIVFHFLDTNLVHDVFFFTFWIFVYVIFNQLFLRSGQIVLGIIDGTEAVAIFALSVLLVGLFSGFGYVIASVLLPRATQMVARKASCRELTDLMIKGGRLQYMLLTYIMGGFFVLGFPFLGLWAGEAYQAAWLPTLLMMASLTITLAQEIAVSIQQAMGRNVFRAFERMGRVVVAVAVGLAATNYWDGPLAMGIGVTAATIVGIIVMTVYNSRIIGIEMRRFYYETMTVQSYCFVVALSLSLVLVHAFPVTGLGMFISEGILYSLFFGLITWQWGIDSSEKKQVLDLRHAMGSRLRFVKIFIGGVMKIVSNWCIR